MATLEDLENRQVLEVDEGVEVKIFLGEENAANYVGSIQCFNDPMGYRKKLNAELDRWRRRQGKPKTYILTESEREPLEDRSHVGTYFRRISGFKNADGVPLESTEDNILRLLQNNLVRSRLMAAVNDEATWVSEAVEAVKGN